MSFIAQIFIIFDLRQTKTMIIKVRWYTYCRIHFTSRNASFCDICVCNNPGEDRMSQRPSGRAPTYW